MSQKRTAMGKSLAMAAIASLSLFTAACGSGGPKGDVASTSDAPATSDAAANLVGPGCEKYARAVPKGKGSVVGMAEDPVATAFRSNPLLRKLDDAVDGTLNKEVNLVDKLNGGEFTVFAPVDSAFVQLDARTTNSLATPQGAHRLSDLLNYHVVLGQFVPKDVDGTHMTVNGADLTVSGSGDNIEVGGGQAKVICGGFKTANATVYLIDTILMPPKD